MLVTLDGLLVNSCYRFVKIACITLQIRKANTPNNIKSSILRYILLKIINHLQLNILTK